MKFGEKIYEDTLRRAVLIERFKAGQVRQLIKIVTELEGRLKSKLRDGIDGATTRTRAEALIRELRKITKDAHEQLEKKTGKSLEDFAKLEMAGQVDAMNDALPTKMALAIQFIKPADPILYQAASGSFEAKLIQGQTLSEWYKRTFARVDADITREVRLGLLEGRGEAAVTRAVVGARTATNSVSKTLRRNMNTLVRTGLQAASAEARQAVYTENKPLLKGVRWVSTLDGRTSSICQARDGLLFDVNEGPRPPAHFGCRSTTVPVTKSWQELGFDADEPKKGMRPFIRSKQKLKDIPVSERSALVGRVKSDTTYSEFLSRQSKGFQEDVLGTTKAKLFRDGGLSLDKFVDMKTGRELTIDELSTRYKENFRQVFD